VGSASFRAQGRTSSADVMRGGGGTGAMSAYPITMLVFGVAFLGYLIYLQTRVDVPTNGVLRGASDLFVLFGALVCAGACWATARRLRGMMAGARGLMTGRAWIAWALLGTSAFSYAVGQAIWTWYDSNYTSANLPFPALYDPFYLAVYPLAWVGVALLIPRVGSAAGRTRLLLDAGIVVASALAISWYFILGPTLSSLMGTTIAKVVALAYPLGDLSLCVAAALLIFGPLGAAALNAAIARLGIGVALLALTDSLYAYFTLAGTYHTGLLQDFGWPMSWLFIGWAALVYPLAVERLMGQRTADARSVGATRLGTAGAALRAISPMILALATCAVLILEVALRKTAPFEQVILVCAVIFALPVIRQALTLVDNLLLTERLRQALDQSTQAFQLSQQELLSTADRADRYDELRTGIQDLQAVHARLARGDWSARASVQGPLTPVAQSLNLLIERMMRWGQLAQVNQVMEVEVQQLHQALDALSEGQIVGVGGRERSAFSTGSTLASAARLERQLWLRFGRMREAIEMLARRWRASADTLRQVNTALAADGGQYQLPQAQQALARAEEELSQGQMALRGIWDQANIYTSPTPPGAQEALLDPHFAPRAPYGGGPQGPYNS
jgi:hypothetical protein